MLAEVLKVYSKDVCNTRYITMSFIDLPSINYSIIFMRSLIFLHRHNPVLPQDTLLLFYSMCWSFTFFTFSLLTTVLSVVRLNNSMVAKSGEQVACGSFCFILRHNPLKSFSCPNFRSIYEDSHIF